MKLRRLILLLVCIIFSGKCRQRKITCTIKQEKLELTADCSNLGLTRVPQDLNHTIFALDLSKNRIKILRNNSFERYTQLAVLTIDSNDLYFLDADTFFGLHNLVKLSMNNNKLNLSTAYSNEIFSHTPQLRYLDIGSNQVTTHKYTTLTMYPYFGDMKNLQTLYLDLVNLPVFNSSGLYTLKNLDTVRFSSCTLEEMLNGTFVDMPPSVKQIYLNNCEKVKIVEANFLKPFLNLQILELCGVFIHLSRALELLYPFQNKNMTSIIFKRVTVDFQDSNKYPYAVRVTREMMKYLQTICVDDLVLAESGIVDFEPGSLLTYNHPECFKRIVFTGNRFSMRDGKSKTMEFITFQSRTINLRVFDYSYNPIKYSNIDYGSDYIQSNNNSDGEYQYETLQHENNPLVRQNVSPHKDQYIYTYTVSLPPNLEALRFSHYLTPTDSRINLMIKRAQNLRHLDVSYFQTSYFPQIYFDGDHNIEFMNMSGIDANLYCLKHSKVKSIFQNLSVAVMQNIKLGQAILSGCDIFNLLPVIENLDVSSNNMWFLPKNAFMYNNKLRILNMKINSFTEIPTAVTALSNLEFLDLRNNYIQSINETIRKWLDQQYPRMLKLYLGGNTFSCTCDTMDFVKWLFTTKTHFDRPQKDFDCRLSNGSVINTLHANTNFHDLFSHCDSETWLQVGIGLIVAFFVCAVPVAIIISYRWKIMFYIYKKFRRVVEKGLRQKCQYDVYLSYAEDSQSWVINSLRPKLEETWKMKVCIGDRDFLVGESKSEAIANAISESRHVIFFISKDSKDEQWLRFEIDRARYEKDANFLQKIIVITGKADMGCIPDELCHIWKDVIGVTWPDNESDNGWQTLKLALWSELS